MEVLLGNIQVSMYNFATLVHALIVKSDKEWPRQFRGLSRITQKVYETLSIIAKLCFKINETFWVA